MIALQNILEALIIVLIWSVGFAIFLFSHPRVCKYYEEQKMKKYWQKWEKDYEEMLQQQRRKELHRKEMEKYPLFFWKELTNEV